MVEFSDQETAVFDEVMQILEKQPSFESTHLCNETIIALPGLDIYPKRRKVYRNHQEIRLTTKEHDLLYLLAVNKGLVLTYEQIYDKVWKGDSLGNENKVIGLHIHNLRAKLSITSLDSPITIRCVREVGYCLEVNPSYLVQ